MKTKVSKKAADVAAKATKPKTATSLRDLPPRKDARGGASLAREEARK